MLSREEGGSGEGDFPTATPCLVDKLFSSDRVAKFDLESTYGVKGQLQFGRVSMNSKTNQVRIEWDDGYDEELEKNQNGQVTLQYKVGVIDRRSIGYGSKVFDGKRTGTVREKHFWVTASLENDPTKVLVDIPAEDLISSGYSKKGDKILYKNEWIGLVVDTRAKVYFTMDKDGKSGKVGDDSYGSKFPHPGEKIKSMPISHLWDAEWDSGNWLWNFVYYLADPATITRTEIDCMSIAWMGRVDSENGVEKGEKTPPNIIRISGKNEKVKFMYGRNWKYIREYGSWLYRAKKGEALTHYDTWAKDLSDKMFFGLSDKSIDMEKAGGMVDPYPQIEPLKLEEGTEIYIKIIMWRSVLDIEWDDGTLETLPSYAVKPHGVINSTPIADLIAGDIVKDKREVKESSKYGYVMNIMNNGMVKVKWVTPSLDVRGQPQISVSEVSKFDVALKMEYIYLRCLHNLPVVVPIQKGLVFDGVRTGIAVGIYVQEAKIVVRCPDGLEHLVWAHNFKHFKGDVIEDIMGQKWVTWNDPGHLFYSKGGNQLEEQENPQSLTKGDPAFPIVLSLSPCEDAESRPAFRYCDSIPEDNFFHVEEFSPRACPLTFQNALENEVRCFTNHTPSGIWIEAYTCRADLFTAFVVGGEGTPYEDHLLIFDFKLPQDFPLTPPDICFSSYDVTVSPCLGSDGAVTIPDSLHNYKGHQISQVIGDEDNRSIILDKILIIKDKILVENPYYLAHPVEKATVDNAYAIDYNNFVTLNMLEYTENVLRSPPQNWQLFISSYFTKALPRIISRYEKLIATSGDFDESQSSCHTAFILGLKSRLKKLGEFLPQTTQSDENRN